jgi:hypothetical protein
MARVKHKNHSCKPKNASPAIITLEPYALNVEFQHSYPDLIKFPYFADTTGLRFKEGLAGERRPKGKVKTPSSIGKELSLFLSPSFSASFWMNPRTQLSLSFTLI